MDAGVGAVDVGVGAGAVDAVASDSPSILRFKDLVLGM